MNKAGFDYDYLFIHKFKVSSGKDYKEVTKVYYDRDQALDNHILLGGTLLIAKVVHQYK